MSFDVMRVRLHLRGVRVTGVVVDTPAELVVGVVSVRTLSSCPFCGLSCQQVHDRRRREIRDLEHGGRSTVLLWTQRRFVCGHCGKRHMGKPSPVRRQYYPAAGPSAGPRRSGDADQCGVPASSGGVASGHETGC